MAFKCYCLLSFLVILGLVMSASVAALTPGYNTTSSMNRGSFPAGFIFGTASSAYQYEGAAAKGGRGPSIWDTYTHKYPGRIKDGSNGDVAVDSYDLYKEDVKVMKEMGLDAYRFSISWSRILPKGKLGRGVNKEGIKYYNNLINELLSNGIQPFVTLFHWDLPQALEDEYGGFLSHKVVNDFKDYAEICFEEFGDRVKHWITLNEPFSFSMGAYAAGLFAPGRCSAWLKLNCTGGDSATEPYWVAHNQLLAHATAVKLYKQKYQTKQKGVIGITLVSHWFVPYSDARHNKNAAKRALDFMLGCFSENCPCNNTEWRTYSWNCIFIGGESIVSFYQFMDPLTDGDYPHTMRSLVGNRLPKFSDEQSRLIKGSFDFLGLNYYTANYAAYMPHPNSVHASYFTDSRANLSTDRNGVPIGPKAASDWLFVYPRGIRDLLLYVKNKYNEPLIYITENGIDEANNGSLTLKEALVDNMRIDYYYRHLSFVRKAIMDGVNVKAYFAWSLLDNFEWYSGYTVRFGINYIDYKDGLKRYPKLSAHWFKNFLKK